MEITSLQETEEYPVLVSLEYASSKWVETQVGSSIGQEAGRGTHSWSDIPQAQQLEMEEATR